MSGLLLGYLINVKYGLKLLCDKFCLIAWSPFLQNERLGMSEENFAKKAQEAV
jgi:hypothetical protein